MAILNIANQLSILRGFSSVAFLFNNIPLRCAAIIVAIITDSLDGYLARKLNQTSRLGVVLDPLMDKVFVLVALFTFIYEDKLLLWQAGLFLSRDVALALFSLYLYTTGRWSQFMIHSFFFGKIFTSLQFFLLLTLSFGYSFSNGWFLGFLFLGLFSFLELFMTKNKYTLDH